MSGPRLGITMGDPAGIGPEIIAKACARLKPRLADGSLSLLIIGSVTAMRTMESISGRIEEEQPSASAAGTFPAVAILEAGPEQTPIETGIMSAEGGRLAYLAIEKAVRLAQAGSIAGIVTAPLNKEALNLAGYHYAGHTDMLAELTGARDSVMMLAHGDFRVSHVSTHVALAQVPSKLTEPRLRRVIQLTVEALHGLGISHPRIAIAALNPHAGEGGIFGREDIDITTPVVASYNSADFAVFGPVPGDTVFVKLRARQYDAVVAMYHDQGHIPVKLLGFNVDPETGEWKALSGVNVTLGLPIIRTSVDHGTAFDIAGKGIANEDSLVEAIEFAVQMAAAKSNP
ncbi:MULTISPECIES: 4-hydroxythreonine-4-phosphate dehydrogenase PdxA [Mesorhizobium]|uniref:4-hydroxythreonine-4-phosphate dehydrogenase PdxA n=3 Tax=Mesorhizobium TaxID=68287 RepID=A0AB38T9M9_9HYPH|nr:MULTISPECIES: 4-hydroxythreonine-4-phosphate dehydrogenase PdxA [Mesorhizobium]MDF3156032.1 4-hydroxythreonine-4-phosphate dehydrogenase PdxA [Mesorhizobium sp. XAP10]MDF3216904.1 4-hydroxythreonine-4-phosphate dehydrogenase PdxA [Mesorhizobium ciceri]MDF3248953.1 4-hydroxythreonine-4-phosphate dehydrogenase PdxA [Mesorhizobium sp. XAP4]UTU51622.1 4-hydroxythreonine-4-phosphate dehydrogenase PdxA [Mesorhizobium ciceri]